MAATAAAARRAASARAPARSPRPAPRRAPGPKRAPARRPATRHRASAPARLIPVAAGRTAGAVSGLADSSLVFRLTRGRLWIGVLTALLVGIVALNVLALSFSAQATRVARQHDVLDRQNSVLRARIADGLANDRVQSEAQRMGYVTPDPAVISYLAAKPGDARVAARRLASGEISYAGGP